LGAAVTPGLCMTPVSSMLEACTVGHVNNEPLYRRWIRGLVPRCSREVIFGVGLNQLSDYCEERVPFVKNSTLKNALGSLSAGIISGYLSHVPHNLSTMKLLRPHISYRQHFADFTAPWKNRMPTWVSPAATGMAAGVMTVLFPKGLTIRTSQIVGTFIILNGIINALKNV